LRAGLDLPLTGKSRRRWRLIIDVDFNKSFFTYENVAGRQLNFVLGLRNEKRRHPGF
jgi:hypothetical protein